MMRQLGVQDAHITLSVREDSDLSRLLRSGSKLKASSGLERTNEMYTLVITSLTRAFVLITALTSQHAGIIFANSLTESNGDKL